MDTLAGIAWILIPFSAIGLVIGGLAASFTEGRGGLQPMWSVITGIIGSFAGGFLSAPLTLRLFGEGPLFIASLMGAALGALVLILIVTLVRRWV